MKRKPAFSLAYLHEHFQTGLSDAYPVLPGIPAAMQELLHQIGRKRTRELSLTCRLRVLKSVFDQETMKA